MVMRCHIRRRETFLMKETILLPIQWLTLVCLFNTIVNAQLPKNSSGGLFDSDDVLNLQFSGEVRDLMKDRSDDMQYHPITLSYLTTDSVKVSIPIKVKTRGHFRRTQGNCRYPPLLLNFSKEETPENSAYYKLY